MMLLSFAMGSETYGVDILKVQEIRQWEGATPLPRTAQHVRGVINLRGEIVPVLDLRERLGLPVAQGGRPVVIVFRLHEKRVGGIVDAVLDVHSLAEGEVQAAPAGAEFVAGLATVEEQLLILLDTERLMEESLCEGAKAPPESLGEV